LSIEVKLTVFELLNQKLLSIVPSKGCPRNVIVLSDCGAAQSFSMVAQADIHRNESRTKEVELLVSSIPPYGS
jgi:hypothetical protein